MNSITITAKDNYFENILTILKNLPDIMIDKIEVNQEPSFISTLSKEKQLEAKEIISGIQKGLDDMKNGKTYPIETLWDKLDD